MGVPLKPQAKSIIGDEVSNVDKVSDINYAEGIKVVRLFEGRIMEIDEIGVEMEEDEENQL